MIHVFEGSGRKRSWLISRYYSGIYLEGLRRTTKISARIVGFPA
jgi:hypothetical protein